jgi:FMN-dependent NADH-azoreductase
VHGRAGATFTVPSTLKSWIDHVAIAGQTFCHTAEGPRGWLSGKVYLVLSSGGMHSQAPFAAYDHLSTYLTAIFNFLGILDVEVIRAEGIAYGTGAGSSRDGERCSEY